MNDLVRLKRRLRSIMGRLRTGRRGAYVAPSGEANRSNWGMPTVEKMDAAYEEARSMRIEGKAKGPSEVEGPDAER